MSTESLDILVRRSDRKTMALTVQQDGSVLVRAPRRISEAEIRRFVGQHLDWIETQREKQQALQQERARIQKLSNEELQQLAQSALRDLPERARRFAPRIGVNYGRITIRNQRSKWGSCSSKGNLNFNCLLMLAPEYVRDYVVVHELCHRRHMDHSPAFWAEVERALPDYQQGKAWLKTHGAELMARNPSS